MDLTGLMRNIFFSVFLSLFVCRKHCQKQEKFRVSRAGTLRISYLKKKKKHIKKNGSKRKTHIRDSEQLTSR